MVLLCCSIGITDVHLNWLKWFHLLIFRGGLLVILIGCMIFLSPFLDVTRTSMSIVSFLVQLDSEILCLLDAYLWSMIQMALSIELIDNCRFFLNRFPVWFPFHPKTTGFFTQTPLGHSAFHPSVDKMSTRNFWELSGKKNTASLKGL